jgi:hypothetical protein
MRPKAINIQNISATTPFERFKQFTKQIISIPKKEIDRREAEYRAHRQAHKKVR